MEYFHISYPGTKKRNIGRYEAHKKKDSTGAGVQGESFFAE